MCADRLLELAARVSDEEGVDWEAESSQEPGLSPALERLRQIEKVASAFRVARDEAEESTDPATPLLFRWGRLEVLEKLGEGSFAEVYRARDPHLDREVALKLRRSGPSTAEAGGRAFVAEARRLARLRHPHVVAVYGADIEDGRVGLWTELVDGVPLDRWLESEGRLDPHQAVEIAIQLCQALAAVHAAGLVHSDVKAANVLRERGGRVVLADLGSGVEQRSAPALGSAQLSPLTAAPEVLAGGAPSAASDLYSLGVLLYRLLGGAYPVEAASVAELSARHARGARRPLRDLRPDCPERLLEIVERVLELDPEKRPASAGALEQELRAAFTELGEAQSTVAGVSAPRVRLVRPILLWLAAAVVLAAGIAGLVVGRGVAPPVATNTSPAQGAVPVQPEPSQPGAALVSAAVPQGPPTVAATVLRSRGDQVERLASGGRVAPGDHLFLEVEAGEPVNVFVVSGDQAGDAFLLFPLSDLQPANPLPSGRHRLPGRRQGVPQDWTVTSAGGRETLLVVASRQPLPELESELAAMRAAHSGQGAAGEKMRGIGGVEPASVASSGLARVEAVVARLEARYPSLWLKRFDLENPAAQESERSTD